MFHNPFQLNLWINKLETGQFIGFHPFLSEILGRYPHRTKNNYEISSINFDDKYKRKGREKV